MKGEMMEIETTMILRNDKGEELKLVRIFKVDEEIDEIDDWLANKCRGDMPNCIANSHGDWQADQLYSALHKTTFKLIDPDE